MQGVKKKKKTNVKHEVQSSKFKTNNDEVQHHTLKYNTKKYNTTTQQHNNTTQHSQNVRRR